MTNEEFIESIRLEGEEWRDVVGYEGLYMVSSCGRVISNGRNVDHGKKGIQYKQPKIIRQAPAYSKKDKYLHVSLHKDGLIKCVSVHRAVLTAFRENPDGYPEIDHINRDCHDNRVENLKWCTHSMNMLNEKTRAILSSTKKGRRLPKQWVSVVRLLDGKEVERFDSISMAEEFGYVSSAIVKVCNGLRKKYKGYGWMYSHMYDELQKRKKKYNKS